MDKKTQEMRDLLREARPSWARCEMADHTYTHTPAMRAEPSQAPAPQRQYTLAAHALREILARDCRHHALRLADIVGVYPT